MSDQINDTKTAGTAGVVTRRSLLLSLPGLALARRRLLAQEQAAPLAVLGLHQVTLAVSDLERSLDFYQGLFGMPVQARHEGTILLRIGDGPHFMALTEAGSQPPSISRFGLAVEDYDVGRIVSTLAGHDVTPGDWMQTSSGVGWSGGPMRIGMTNRGGTRELHMGDPNGLVIQLHDPSYCGGGGSLGDRCGPPEPSPTGGSIALSGLSHLTINVPDPVVTNEFYQQTFGMDIQTYQAASPLMGVGPGVHFLMFTSSGGGGARINHISLSLENFDVERIQGELEEHSIMPRGEDPAGPLQHRVSMRMPNRGGAADGTPELYFSDPDGLSIQLQDVTYCGGGGYLGGVCP